VIFIVAACLLGLLALCAYQQRQIDKLLTAQELERGHWAVERRDLNNRIQVPEAAPFMKTDEPPEATTREYVPFDDDAAFHEAQTAVEETREALERQNGNS
jgi:hypothetical protein